MNLFTESELKFQIIDSITEIGYQTPTEIQKLTIPFLLKKKQDLIALAQTGTGKTAAFGLPLIHQIDENASYTQAIILCPTRELCLQITRDIQIYTSKMPHIRSLAVYGGSSIIEQIRELKKHPQIIIGTPGRLNDMIRRKVMNLSKIDWIVLDEADEMLSMGFKEELELILSETPEEKQTLLFSATMSKSVEKIAKGYMKNPHKIAVGSINSVKKNISHSYCITRYNQKLQVLHRILDVNPNNYTIIFCRTRIETQQVSDYLTLQGFSADSLHGDLSQAQRDTVMKKFRYKNLKTLVATDVAARGLDVNNLTHVIHFSLPDDPEVFVHRSGRTGRAGKFGQSVCLIKVDELRKLRRIEFECSIKINPINIPSNEEIIQTQINEITGQIISDKTLNLNTNLNISELPDLSHTTKEELLKKFVYFYLRNTINYYETHPTIIYNEKSNDYDQDRDRFKSSRNNKNLRIERRSKFERAPRDGQRRKPGKSLKNSYTRIFMNLGRHDQLSKLDILAIINRNVSGNRIGVGEINIHDKFSFFEVDSNFKNELLKNINNNSFNGKNINVEEATNND